MEGSEEKGNFADDALTLRRRGGTATVEPWGIGTGRRDHGKTVGNGSDNINFMYMEKSEIELVVAKYFGANEYEVDVQHCGKIAMVDVKYKDFKPMVIVRRELEDMIPMARVNISERYFSDDVIKDELMKLYDNDVEVVDGGRKVSLIVLIEEKLFDKGIG